MFVVLGCVVVTSANVGGCNVDVVQEFAERPVSCEELCGDVCVFYVLVYLVVREELLKIVIRECVFCLECVCEVCGDNLVEETGVEVSVAVF